MLEASERLPEGLYTTLRTYSHRRILRPGAHAARLSEAGGTVTEADVLAGVAAALRASRHPESRLRLTASGRALFVSVEAFEPLPALLYERGAEVVTLDLHRDDPGAKRTGFIATAAHAYGALPPGVHEGLLVTRDGRILEGLSSNVFFVLRGELRTAGAEVLPGVTRSILLELAAEVLLLRLEPVRQGELPEVSEAFLTSVSRGILPLVGVDGRALGDGRPGPRTGALSERFAALVERESVLVP
jgi:branched-chain amino acid aminotransferase